MPSREYPGTSPPTLHNTLPSTPQTAIGLPPSDRPSVHIYTLACLLNIMEGRLDNKGKIFGPMILHVYCTINNQ